MPKTAARRFFCWLIPPSPLACVPGLLRCIRQPHQDVSVHSPATPPLPQNAHPSLLRQWAFRVVLPLACSVCVAFGLLFLAATGVPNLLASDGGVVVLWTCGALMVAALALVLAISWAVAQRIVRPLDELSVAIEQLGHGETVQLQPQGGGALARLQQGVNEASRQLSQTRNRMQTELGRTSVELADKNARLEAASLARARLLAAASHDLRQPLYALTLFSSTLRAGETDPDKRTRILHIEECVASLDQLFSELLDLSRLEAGSMRAVPTDVRLDDVFDEVSRNFRMLAESRGLRLVVRKTDAWVHGDRTMLARILNNLVSNALRYTEEGGVLVGVRLHAGGKVRIDVCDTGCGIAPEHQHRVFEEFYQVKQGRDRTGERKRGLGLGLATVQKLAEMNGCTVRLTSRVGRGTRVSVVIEASTTGGLDAMDCADLPLDISGIRVLAIDDEPSILDGLRTLLLEWGCEIRVASDAAEAIARLGDWQQPPDLVISDLHLQDGNTGPEVLQAIARHYGQAPDAPKFARLLVTGETRPDIIDAITATGIPVLFKPVAPPRLREAMLASVLATRSRNDS